MAETSSPSGRRKMTVKRMKSRLHSKLNEQDGEDKKDDGGANESASWPSLLFRDLETNSTCWNSAIRISPVSLIEHHKFDDTQFLEQVNVNSTLV